MTRRLNLLDDLGYLSELSENMSNTIFLAGYLARENQNCGLQQKKYLIPRKFIHILTNFIGVMQRFIRKEVLKRRWASNIEDLRENEIIKW